VSGQGGNAYLEKTYLQPRSSIVLCNCSPLPSNTTSAFVSRSVHSGSITPFQACVTIGEMVAALPLVFVAIELQGPGDEGDPEENGCIR
jgi:hypothetical protein